MASERRNMFYQNNKQEMTEIVQNPSYYPLCTLRPLMTRIDLHPRCHPSKPPPFPHCCASRIVTAAKQYSLQSPFLTYCSHSYAAIDTIPLPIVSYSRAYAALDPVLLSTLHIAPFIWKRFFNDDEVKEAVEKWLSQVKRSVFDEGIEKLVPRLMKCIEVEGDYVDK
ncbi:hypothetical protein AAG570_005788 [Ranatra chinensis]|uniref:Uncharacterized protein n=1 Tax=Ranatra chinensis TaxID=642074 RepID=A0ABD0YDF5_9HEMI